MITIDEYIRTMKNPGEKLIDSHISLYPREKDMLEKFCSKYKLNRTSAARYFCILGMQTHRKRSRMRKEYGDDAVRRILREEIIEEYERRLETEY